MTTHDDVAIVGMGAVLPDALDVPTAWSNLVAGHSAIRPLPPEIWDTRLGVRSDRSSPDHSYSGVGAYVRGFEFDPGEFGLPPVATPALDPIQTTFLVAAKEALGDAGIHGPTGGVNGAVIIGNLQGGNLRRGEHWFRIHHDTLEANLHALPAFSLLSPEGQRGLLDELRRSWHEQFPPITSDSLPGLLGNIAASRVAHYFNLHGPAMVIDAACASSLAALEQAVLGLQLGRFDLAVSGGADFTMDRPSYVGFCAMGALSPDGSYPFDERANGFVMGEGSIAFVLKRLADARRDGNRVYAVIRGIGATSDGRGRSLVAPNPDGQVRAMRQAWSAARIDPSLLGYLEAHGTATPIGDPTEVAAIRAFFTDCPTGSIPMGSVKANVGHLKGAAGAAGLLRAALAVYHQTIPPHANFDRPNPTCELERAPVRILTEPEAWLSDERVAAVSAFGFGGVNYHVVLSQGDSAHPDVADHGLVPASAGTLPLGLDVVAFGANTREDLLDSARRLRAELDSSHALARRCLREEAPASFPQRIAFFAGDEASTRKQLDTIIDVLEKGGSQARLEAIGVSWRDGEEPFGPDSVVFMSPGQGSQYVGMLDELRARFPTVQGTFDAADEIISSILEQKLSSYISPPAGKDAGEAFVDLLRTEVLQPAMLACDEALHRLIRTVVKPRAVLGHSLGEYGSCIAAGVIDFADALRIVAARGEAMEEVPVDDNGLMLGVNAEAPTVERLIADIDGYVVVVNKNCPSQTIIGGATQAVQQAQEELQKAGYETLLLPVSHAFHSQIVAPASAPLRRALDRVEIHAPTVPILSNVTGDFYPNADDDETHEWIRDTLARHVASPVEFIAEIERAYSAGCRVFLEVGPKRAQAGFVSDILKGRPHRSLHLVHPKVGELTQLGRTVAALVADGVIEYGRPRLADTVIHRRPNAHPAEPSPHTVAAQRALADLHERAERPAAAAGSSLLDQLAGDAAFWQFVGMQGPAIINSLAASYQAARAMQMGMGVATLPGMAIPHAAPAIGPAPAGAKALSAPLAPAPQATSTRAPAGPAPAVAQPAPAASPGYFQVAAAAPVSGFTFSPGGDWHHPRSVGISTAGAGTFGLSHEAALAQGVAPVAKSNGKSNGHGKSARLASVAEAGPVAAPESGRAATSTDAEHDLTGWVLQRVATITGYRVDELDLDAHLESELGIDSIRQIEIILGLRDELKLEADDSFRVSDYPNLRTLIGYLHDRTGASPDF